MYAARSQVMVTHGGKNGCDSRMGGLVGISMGADKNLFLDLHTLYTVYLIIHFMKIDHIVHL